jgi:dephospho-CoA kinase
MDKVCDVVYAVAVSPEAQLARLAARDGAGIDDAKRRVAAQKLTADEKAMRADVVLPNEGTSKVCGRLWGGGGGSTIFKNNFLHK